MALAGCARDMSPAAFDAYWQTGSTAAHAPAAGVVQNVRRSWQGRSLKEINIALAAEAKAGAKQFSDEEAACFTQFFTRLSPDIARRDAKLLAQDVAGIALRTPAEKLKEIIAPLQSKATFWPAAPAKASYDDLAVWGDISAKDIDALAAATALGFSEEYLADCAQVLPLKALNSICPRVDADLLYDVAMKLRRCSCDLLLWIWKNRKKHNSTKLLSLVDIENVCRSLNITEEPPRIWNGAVRELRTALMDNSEFQQYLLRNSPGMEEFARVLQGATFLGPRDRQSLLVKMARNSEELREYLENGAARKLIGAESGVSAPAETTEFTSALSRQRMQNELDDLLNVQIPENREAFKTARAHGDFRENAEFDAAKERRNFLSRRRGELERELANLQPVSLRIGDPEGVVQIGTVVTLRDDAGAETVYTLLGAWDGDPERNFVSYRTRLGQAVYRRAEGDRVTLPNGSQCVIVKVTALPEDLLKELE